MTTDAVSVSPEALGSLLDAVAAPVLVLSTRVGRGMFSIGEALVERVRPGVDVTHRAVEELLPATALREDVDRYRWISSRAPWLLHIPYRVPWIYRRKLVRERRRVPTDLTRLRDAISDVGAKTVVCVSHRPAFWTSVAKERHDLDATVVGLLGEYGPSLGWRYVSWPQIDAFWSPVSRGDAGVPDGTDVEFATIDLPARREFESLADVPGERRRVLVVCGSWGQGPLRRVVGELLDVDPAVAVEVVCGDNEAARRSCERLDGDRVIVHGEVESLGPAMARCGSVVTKPGIATLVEARAARRKLFLLRGMPVAEDHNARHAVAHFDAEWYRADAVRAWLGEGRA